MRGSAAFRTGVAPGGALAPGWVKNELWRKARTVPSLDLRFADNKSLVDAVTGAQLVTFTRASSGTFVGSDGLLKTAVTNLLLRSEEFDNASWTKVATTVLANQIQSPIGTLTADEIIEDSSTGNHYVTNGSVSSSVSGTAYTYSVYVKAGQRAFCFLLANGTGTLQVVSVNLSTGVATSAVGSPSSITSTDVGNGWYRISFSYTSGTTGSVGHEVRLSTNGIWGDRSYTGNGAGSVYTWGAQLEQSATVGEYIPTTSVINSAPRFDHNPTTGESLGLLVEEARTNVLLNSATLSTQSVTVAAAANTLSFYGTGTVTLTGVSTAGPLVGTGANNRVSLTFTPTVGVLILTVSGSVTNAQLEAGAFATSYIPTAAATVTRAADVASIGSGSAFTSWMTSFDENTFFIEYNKPPALTTQGYLIEGHESSSLRGLSAGLEPGQVPRITIRHGSSRHDTVGTMAAFLTGTNRIAAGTSASGSASASNGVIYTGGTTTQSDWTAGSAISIGRRGAFNTNFANTPIRRLTFWPTRFSNEVLQRISQP